jgi:hypothetical protein
MNFGNMSLKGKKYGIKGLFSKNLSLDERSYTSEISFLQ